MSLIQGCKGVRQTPFLQAAHSHQHIPDLRACLPFVLYPTDMAIDTYLYHPTGFPEVACIAKQAFRLVLDANLKIDDISSAEIPSRHCLVDRQYLRERCRHGALPRVLNIPTTLKAVLTSNSIPRRQSRFLTLSPSSLDYSTIALMANRTLDDSGPRNSDSGG